MILNFEEKRTRLETSFTDQNWLEESGLSLDELEKEIAELENSHPSRAVVKAKCFYLLATKARIAPDPNDIFQNHLQAGKLMLLLRRKWEAETREKYFPEAYEEITKFSTDCGSCNSIGDYGHNSPNTRLMLKVGLPGLLARVKEAAARENLTQKQQDFYTSCRIVLEGMIKAALRLAEGIRPHNPACAQNLEKIATQSPKTSYEAMQLLVLYFFLHEYVGGTRMRTLGRLDVLLTPFYESDLKNGLCTEEEWKEMMRFFLFKFWCAKVPFDLPFCLSGMDENGVDVTNRVSHLIVETYNELNIHSPKIHIRVCDSTPKDFLKKVLSFVRGGNSSFLFMQDRVSMDALMRVGISKEDAWDYVPIGCYEPAVWGKEMGCTGNGWVVLPKAMELVFNNGRDLNSGILCGVETGTIGSFEDFLSAIKDQIRFMTRKALDYVITIETHYDKINPDPILSCQYDRSVEEGLDVYEGGATYNNSSLSFLSLATLVDGIMAVKKTVFDRKDLSFARLVEILKNNWSGEELLRRKMLGLSEKFGNADPEADAITKDLAKFCADLVNNKPNGRGGVFKAGLFSIDRCFRWGKTTMATPDGRFAGDPLSKNLCATTGMDRKGVTALIRSVTTIDLADFPNGTVLDVVLHPSAVSGDDGLDAFLGILLTYFKLGGYALHGNVFHADALKKAQENPDAYRTLQVRVCGWNAFFVNLSREEQDAFIRQAEGAE